MSGFYSVPCLICAPNVSWGDFATRSAFILIKAHPDHFVVIIEQDLKKRGMEMLYRLKLCTLVT